MSKKAPDGFLVGQNITKAYGKGKGKLKVVKGITLTVDEGESVMILGPSGAGKSTLLHILGLLDTPTGGSVYFQGRNLEDFGWLINYSPSASRWLDGYFAVGVEWDQVVEDDVTTRNSYTVTETGIKFRFDFTRTRLRFLSKLGTPFWGFRVGFQMRGVWSFDNIGYVFEFGAGSW